MSDVSLLTDEDQPIDPDDELLVAYLDGELDSNQRDELEQRLMDSEPLRSRLQELQSGWDMLEEIPTLSTNEKLVESTLELVVDDIIKKSPKKVNLDKRSNFAWVGLGVCVLAAATTYGAIAWFNARMLRQQMVDLAIAENLDAYQYGSDLTWMRELEANSAWRSTVNAAQEVGLISSIGRPVIAVTPVSERQSALEDLSIEQRSSLDAKWDRFTRLDADVRHNILDTAAKLDEKKDADSLLDTMKIYAAWRAMLPSEFREQLGSDDQQQRSKALSRAIWYTRGKIQRYSGSVLDDDDSEWIYIYLKDCLRDRALSSDAIAKKLRDNRGSTMENALIRKMLGSRSYSELPYVPEITDQEVLRFWEQGYLSDAAHANLGSVLGLGSFDVQHALLVGTLRQWMYTVTEKRGSRPRKTAIEQYNDLDDDERDIVDLLPPERIKYDLNDRYRSRRRRSSSK